MFEIGSSLREARLRHGLDFPEVEQATKIRAKHLKALEDEQFELLPAQTYVKGFLRTYAEYLGLDGQLYVDEFNSRFATGEEDLNPLVRASVARGSRRVAWRPVLFAVLGIAAVAGLVIAAWTSGGPNRTRAPIPPKVDAGSAPPSQTQRPKRKKKPAAKPKPVPKQTNLSLTATTGASWIEVHVGTSQDGTQLAEETMQLGTTKNFRAPKLWLNVGQPGNLTWKLNGKVQPAPGTEPGIYVVTPKRIAPASTTG